MLSTFIKDLVDDASGATAIEYGLIVALITIAIIAALQGFAGEAITMWNNVADRTSEAMNN